MSGRANNGLDAVLRRLRPSQWDLFTESPFRYVANLLYSIEANKQGRLQTGTGVKVVCISEGHNFELDIPYADLLIHTGVSNGQELQSVLDWLRSFPHPNKIMIPGYSYALSRSEERAKLDLTGITLLDANSTTIKFSDGRELNIFGSSGKSHPRDPGFWGFSGSNTWAGRVPIGTDILVSYLPPGQRFETGGGGDNGLLAEMWRTKPRLQVSGNRWAGRGKELIVYDRFGTLFERICSSPSVPMATIMLVEMLIRFIGFTIWQARSGDGATIVRAAAPKQLKQMEKEKPIAVYL